MAELKSKIPFGVEHPLLRTHPETGKTALFFNSSFLRHESLSDAATGQPLGAEVSRALVAQLLQQHHRPEYICRFPWTEGALAFWDNRAVQHYAAGDYCLIDACCAGSPSVGANATPEKPAVPPCFRAVHGLSGS